MLTYREWKSLSTSRFRSRKKKTLMAIDALVIQYEEEIGASVKRRRQTLTLLFHAIEAWARDKASRGKSSTRLSAMIKLKAAVLRDLRSLAESAAATAKREPPKSPEPVAVTSPAARTPGPQDHLRQQLARQRKRAGYAGAEADTMDPEITKVNLQQHLRQALTRHRMKIRSIAEDDFETLSEELNCSQWGQFVGEMILKIPSEVSNKAGCRREALRILTAMMGANPELGRGILQKKVEVVVVPKDVGMTHLPEFTDLKGERTFDGRDWDTVRGVGNVTQWKSLKSIKRGDGVKPSDMKRGRILLAITEENLLGTATTVDGAGCYARGYSTTSHEFAHVLHLQVLNPAQRQVVTQSFRTRQMRVVVNNSTNAVKVNGQSHVFGTNATKDMQVNAALGVAWVDGPRSKTDGSPQNCYSAMNEQEYFAQCVNAWLGTNSGNDPYTSQPRNNGKDWVLSNEPRAMASLLQDLFGGTTIDNTNMVYTE